MISARALFAFHRGDGAKPTELELTGALLESERIDALRTIAHILTEYVKAQAKASRSRRRR